MDISAMDWAAAFPSACTHPDGAAVVLAKVLVELAGLARHLGADRVALVIALAVVVFKPAWSETRSLRLRPAGSPEAAASSRLRMPYASTNQVVGPPWPAISGFDIASHGS